MFIEILGTLSKKLFSKFTCNSSEFGFHCNGVYTRTPYSLFFSVPCDTNDDFGSCFLEVVAFPQDLEVVAIFFLMLVLLNQ